MYFVNKYSAAGNTILSHMGLRFVFSLILLNIIVSSVAFLFKNCKNQKFFVSLILIICINVGFIFKKENIYDYDFSGELFLIKQIKKHSYVLEKVFLLNKKMYNDNTVYLYTQPSTDKITIYQNIEIYLFNSYNHVMPEQYTIKPVCIDKSNYGISDFKCFNDMIKFAKDKFNYEFTAEELVYPNFNDLYKMNQELNR